MRGSKRAGMEAGMESGNVGLASLFFSFCMFKKDKIMNGQSEVSKRFDCKMRFGEYKGDAVSTLSHNGEGILYLAEILKKHKHEMYPGEMSCYAYHINPFAGYSMSLDDCCK